MHPFRQLRNSKSSWTFLFCNLITFTRAYLASYWSLCDPGKFWSRFIHAGGVFLSLSALLIFNFLIWPMARHTFYQLPIYFLVSHLQSWNHRNPKNAFGKESDTNLNQKWRRNFRHERAMRLEHVHRVADRRSEAPLASLPQAASGHAPMRMQPHKARKPISSLHPGKPPTFLRSGVPPPPTLVAPSQTPCALWPLASYIILQVLLFSSLATRHTHGIIINTNLPSKTKKHDTIL
jgi:hypothetical protein